MNARKGEMKEIISVSIKAAKEAGELLVNNFGKIKTIESKGDRNFATNLDKQAEKMIIAQIKSKFPDHGIIGEEGGTQKLTSDYIWIIDPLDGTHNFMHNIPIFGVSIGIMYRNNFIAGVIYMPVEKELYVGEKGNGAFKNNKRIHVSQTSDLKRCSISFDSSIRYTPKVMLKTLDKLAQEVFNIRMLGSSVRALTYIAEGKLDASVEFHDWPWDFSGAVALIEEAGGKMTTLDGAKLTHQTKGYIASNKAAYQKIFKIVNQK